MAIPRVVDRVGQVLGGRYRLIAPIGTGASASVYLGDDVVLRRRVAVKVLHAALADDEAFLRRFRAEAQAAAALNHPHVMAVYDWGQDEDVPYLVTEFLGGGSLRALLDQGTALTLSQALLVGLETARGLEYAHRRGFVHRDIKPANLLFDDEARLRIADFGLARALAEAAWTEPMGAVLGTAKYASPEQARGEVLDGRSDVYSLALVIVEAVTGRVPFAADTTIGTLMARVEQPLVVPEALGPLAPALAAAGVPDPNERPDAARFGALLLAAAEDLDRPAPLPLAGVRSLEVDGVDGRDPTVVAGGPPDAPAAAPAAPATGRWSRRRAGRAAAAPVVDLTGPVARLDGDPSGELDVPDWVRPATAAAGTGDDTAVVPLDDDTLLGVVGMPDGTTIALPAAIPDERPAPRVTPTSRRQARRAARSARGQDRPRRRVRRVVAVVLVLVLLAGGGSAAWWYGLRTPTHAVPALVGQPVTVAQAVAEGNGWTVEVDRRHDDTAPAGQVLEQEPATDERLAEGGVLQVVVSLGPPPVAVPTDLAGLPVGEAIERAGAVGLGLEATERRFDEEVPADHVIALAEGVGAELPKGSPIPVVVSGGPEPRTIPAGLAGIAAADAIAQLQALRLVPVESRQFSETVPEGQSMGTDPQPGVQVPRDSQVTVIISKGPERIAVPDVRGLSVTEAARRLEAQGFVVSSTQGSPTRPVVGTSPAAGTLVRKGTSVSLTTG